MRVKCEFIIFRGKFFLYDYDVQTKMVVAPGSSENTVSLRHSPRHSFPGGEPCIIYTSEALAS